MRVESYDGHCGGDVARIGRQRGSTGQDRSSFAMRPARREDTVESRHATAPFQSSDVTDETAAAIKISSASAPQPRQRAGAPPFSGWRAARHRRQADLPAVRSPTRVARRSWRCSACRSFFFKNIPPSRDCASRCHDQDGTSDPLAKRGNLKFSRLLDQVGTSDIVGKKPFPGAGRPWGISTQAAAAANQRCSATMAWSAPGCRIQRRSASPPRSPPPRPNRPRTGGIQLGKRDHLLICRSGSGRSRLDLVSWPSRADATADHPSSTRASTTSCRRVGRPAPRQQASGEAQYRTIAQGEFRLGTDTA